MAEQTNSPGTTADDATVGTVSVTSPNNSQTSNNAYATWAFSACFLAGTRVLTPAGWSVIEKLKVGDEILAYTKRGKVRSVVKKLFEREAYEYFSIIAGERVEVTGEHRFFTPNGLRRVRDFIVGDELITENGIVTISKIEKIKLEKPVLVYNHEVGKTKTYFANGFAVHNAKPS